MLIQFGCLTFVGSDGDQHETSAVRGELLPRFSAMSCPVDEQLQKREANA